MLELISYLIIEIPQILASEYFAPTVIVTAVIGAFELVFMILNIRRRRHDT